MKQQSIQSCLYVVATPIGCLADWSYRAIEVLKQVNLVLAEDTRHSRILLDHYHIDCPLKSLHRFNEQNQAGYYIDQLLAGDSLALISDAGTPLISDPGQKLVSLCHEQGIRVIPIPGPSALTAALSAIGLGDKGFSFLGFLPSKPTERKSMLEYYTDQALCTVYYEAPHRIQASLEDLLHIVGPDRKVGVAREMTKRYESIKCLPLSQLYAWIKEGEQQLKGEFVVVVDQQEPEAPDIKEARRVLAVLRPFLSHKDAAKVTSEITGVPKNTIYAWNKE